MGFPTPTTEWFTGEGRDFIRSILSTRSAMSRTLIDNQKVLENMDKEPKYGRKLWGFLCLELWQQEFHDKQDYYKKLYTGEIAIE